MTRPRLAIVFDHQQTAKVPFVVLAGALETDPETAAVPLDFVTRQRSLPEALRACRAERVLVCWSFYSPELPARQAALAAAREALRAAGEADVGPDARVVHVAGGVHASAEPLETLRAGFDLAVVGEGEQAFVDLVRALLRGDDPRAVRGVASLRAPDDPRGPLATTGRAPPIDLEAWPPFAPAHRRMGPIELTRGCIYACGFCQTPFLHRARFRHRSVETVTRWVAVQKEAGYRDYRFLTPTSLSYGSDGPEPDLHALDRLLAAVRGVVGREGRLYYGTFPSECRPEHVTPEALRVLARWVDNRSIIVGAQSGSERVLARVHRGHGVAEVERAVRVALAEGFEPHVDFLLGLPGEEEADLAATLALAERLADLGARVHGHTFMPLPGTPLRDAPPGQLAPATRQRLDRLAARGRLYGQWRAQERTATALAARRPGPARA